MTRRVAKAVALSGAVTLAAFAGFAGSATAQRRGDPRLEQEASPGSGTSRTISPALVRQVQEALHARGYDAGAVDGHWSHATQRAVRSFQGASGLEPTGQLDPPTLAALGLTAGAGEGPQDPRGTGPQQGPRNDGPR